MNNLVSFFIDIPSNPTGGYLSFHYHDEKHYPNSSASEHFDDNHIPKKF